MQLGGWGEDDERNDVRIEIECETQVSEWWPPDVPTRTLVRTHACTSTLSLPPQTPHSHFWASSDLNGIKARRFNSILWVCVSFLWPHLLELSVDLYLISDVGIAYAYVRFVYNLNELFHGIIIASSLITYADGKGR